MLFSLGRVSVRRVAGSRAATNWLGDIGVKRKSVTATMALLGMAIALSARGDPTTLTIMNASVTVTSSSSTTLDFPIARSGDTSYDDLV